MIVVNDSDGSSHARPDPAVGAPAFQVDDRIFTALHRLLDCAVIEELNQCRLSTSELVARRFVFSRECIVPALLVQSRFFHSRDRIGWQQRSRPELNVALQNRFANSKVDTMKWTACKNAFHPDGSLRDIYIRDTTVSDWQEFLSFVSSSGFRARYTRDGEVVALPSSAADVLADRTCAHTLTIDLGAVSIACHFFTPDEIELDLDPTEVTSQRALDSVLGFMSGLGSHVSRDVILTEENSPESIWFSYSFRDGQVRYRRTR